jgi:hypothetical protein
MSCQIRYGVASATPEACDLVPHDSNRADGSHLQKNI